MVRCRWSCLTPTPHRLGSSAKSFHHFESETPQAKTSTSVQKAGSLMVTLNCPA
jgi:hypothetical protein